MSTYSEYIESASLDHLLESLTSKTFRKMNEADGEKKELSPKQKAYNDVMLFGLAKFGADSPAKLSKEQKTEFFNWLKDNWDKEKGEPAKEEVKKGIEKAKEAGIIPKEPKAGLSKEEKEKQLEKEAEEKKKKFKEIIGDV